MADMARAIQGRQRSTVDVIVYEELFDENWSLPDWMREVDVFISGGYNARQLRSKISTPVISMETRLSDLLVSLENNPIGEKEILYAPFHEKNAVLEKVGSLLSVNIVQMPFQTPGELHQILQDYKNRGGSSVIVAGLGYVYAKRLDLNPVFIRPEEALLEYFNIAADMAISLKTSSLRNSELMTILNYYDKGVLLANNDVITVCNPLAANCFRHLNRPIIGLRLSEIMVEIQMEEPAFEASRLLSPLLNQPCVVNGRPYMLDFVPIRVKNSTNGVMINIRSRENSQERSVASPGNRLSKGFVAKHSFQTLTVKSPSFSKAVHLARYYSQTDESIVLLGETGAGKEVMAHAIHNNSKRARHPFVAVNCSAMNEKLLESELFGYDEGAFTGAKRGGKEGLFELANKGTIFLDEIGEISREIQVKLLRAIQEKEIMRVGGTKIIRFDARIIAATNQNLWKLVEEHHFREDLYYRINVLELVIPPLRERREDLYALFSTFLSTSSPNVISKMDAHEEEVVDLLSRYDWPGNIRELNNFSQMTAAMMWEDQSWERLYEAMQEIICNLIERRRRTVSPMAPSAGEPVFREDSRLGVKRENEADRILFALQNAGGSRKEAAEILGMNRSTLWRKMKKYRLLDGEE